MPGHSTKEMCYTSWNVNGLRNVIKRKKVMCSLKTKKWDVVYLQETHLSPVESKRLCKDWVGHVFFSAGSTNSRGVITLINKHVQFKCLREIIDTEGRMIIILAEIQGQTLTLANIYAPNGDHPAFFVDLESKLLSLGAHPIILGGDINLHLDVLDHSSISRSRPPKSVLTLKSLCESLGLVDIWRLTNPRGRDYTFYSNSHIVQAN